MKSIAVVLSVLFICNFIDFAYSACYADPGTRAPESIGIQALDTCCWLHEDTCCARDGVPAILTDIQESLKDLVTEGLTEECYYSLANLECIACDPTQTITMQAAGTVEGGSNRVLIDQILTMRICTSLCKDIYASCNNAGSIAALGVSKTGNYIEFCESIDGTHLTANPVDVTGIFYSAQFLVTEFDCYGGVPKSEIENDVGVCLYSYEECLIPSNSSYINYFNDAASVSFSMILFIGVLSFLFF